MELCRLLLCLSLLHITQLNQCNRHQLNVIFQHLQKSTIAFLGFVTNAAAAASAVIFVESDIHSTTTNSGNS